MDECLTAKNGGLISAPMRYVGAVIQHALRARKRDEATVTHGASIAQTPRHLCCIPWQWTEDRPLLRADAEHRREKNHFISGWQLKLMKFTGDDQLVRRPSFGVKIDQRRVKIQDKGFCMRLRVFDSKSLRRICIHRGTCIRKAQVQ